MRPNVFIRRYKNKKNKNNYYLVVRIPGKKDESRALGSVSRLFVEEERQKLLQQIYSGSYRPTSKVVISFRDFVEKFFDDFAKGSRSGKTVKGYREQLKPFLTHLGDYQLNQISPQLLERVCSGREVSNRTKNIALNTLRLLFRKAVEWDYLDKNPALDIKRLKEEKGGGSRALTYAELCALWDVVSLWQRAIIRVFVYSGLRTNELTNLKFQDIYWDENKLVVRKTKTGKPRDIFLSPDLKEELTFLKEFLPVRRGNSRNPVKPRLFHQREYVFCHENGKPIKSFRKAIGNAFEKAGIKGVSTHGLRKTFCSLLARQGVHVKVAQELMGHRDPSMTLEIYTQVEDDQKKKAVTLLPTMRDMKKEKFQVVQGLNQ